MTKQHTSDVQAFDLAHNAEQEIDEYPDAQPDTSLLASATLSLTIAQSLDIDPSQTQEENARRLLLATSYVGVIPKSIDEYIGEVMLRGCVIAPIEDTSVDEETGEEVTRRWNAVLFKLSDVDTRTNQNIIVSGGGKQGLMFARNMIAAFGPGDWQHDCRVRIQQEARKNGHRMYRMQFLGVMQ